MGTKCKGCGAAIRWVKMASGKPMPVDAVPERRVAIKEEGGGEGTGRVISMWIPHWSTCPQADAFRGGAS